MSTSAPAMDAVASPRKLWQLLPHDAAAINHLARTLNVAPLIAQLLLNRKIAQPNQALNFLQAPLKALHEPEALPGVTEAVKRLAAAITEGRKICIYGDYDVDGV